MKNTAGKKQHRPSRYINDEPFDLSKLNVEVDYQRKRSSTSFYSTLRFDFTRQISLDHILVPLPEVQRVASANELFDGLEDLAALNEKAIPRAMRELLYAQQYRFTDDDLESQASELVVRYRTKVRCISKLSILFLSHFSLSLPFPWLALLSLYFLCYF